jgi:hypothetical protein
MPLNRNMTGTYYFEDENLDVFVLFDFKQTTIQHGINYTDDFYEVEIINTGTS